MNPSNTPYGLTRESVTSEPLASDPCDNGTKSARVTIWVFAFVVPEGLLVQVAEHVESLDADVGAGRA